jgi:nanoRNase/pAp phosphatase (c-di-AMP/oligoRNAs hydrolase)
MKILVTHFSPDLDAISSCWLIKRYLPDWHTASIKFVPAGQTFENKPVDSVSNIIHVDTGLGRFDHHQ